MSGDKEQEYRKLFLEEANQQFEELNRLFINLEKEPENKKPQQAIFRIIHTLKGNAMAMGFDGVGQLAHVMEDVMGAARESKLQLDADIIESLFKSLEKLGALIQSIESGKKVSFLGIKTKLEILLKNTVKDTTGESSSPVPDVDEGSESTDNEEGIAFTDFIQIPVKKMDELMNLVGLLSIERDRLMATEGNENQQRDLGGMKRIISDLQYSILKVRMVPVDFLFNKFHRIVRDAAKMEEKLVELELLGTDVEIDRNILRIISDSMIHLTRNAVSHGIEKPETRRAVNKDEKGKIILEAEQRKDTVLIRVKDNGAGIDTQAIRKKLVERKLVSEKDAGTIGEQEVMMQIFRPGFSNADKVTSLSGRGVGMDVVKKAVESIGGQVNLHSKLGEGTTIELFLPSSLALKSVLTFEQDARQYAVPLSFTDSVKALQKRDIRKIGNGLVMEYQDETIPVVFMQPILSANDLSQENFHQKMFDYFSGLEEDRSLSLIILVFIDRYIALVVDQLLNRNDIIEKPLPKPLNNINLFSGASILGSGSVCPVLDVGAINNYVFNQITRKE